MTSLTAGTGMLAPPVGCAGT